MTVTAEQIDRISILGRFVFGIICLEQILEGWNAKGGRIPDLLKGFWSYLDYLELRRLDIWDENIRELLPLIHWDIPDYTGNLSLSLHQQETLYELIDLVWDIGGQNLYAGYESWCTREPTLKVIHILEENGFQIPDITSFMRSSADENGGWGNPLPKSFFFTNE